MFFEKEAVMAWTKLSQTLIGSEVDRAFHNISGKPGDIRMNPITGEQFNYSYHALEREKEELTVGS